MFKKRSKIKRFLPYGRQSIDRRDIDKVSKILTGDLITQGPGIYSFEKKFSKYVGSKFAVACATGTAALHLACKVLKLGPGKNLLTSPITFVASANCAEYVGAKTYFADIDADNFCISVKAIKKFLLKKKIDVLVLVHMTGHPADLSEIYKLKRKYKFRIIEDACHALGGSYKGKKIGSCKYSDLSTFSFHPTKPITTGEGGIITTNSKELYEQLLILRNHGLHKDKKKFLNKKMAFDVNDNQNTWYYEMNDLGFNYRMTDMQAALGESQIKKIDKFTRIRNQIAKTYNKSFSNNILIKTPKEKSFIKHSYHLYTILINFKKLKKSRNQIMRELRNENIGTQVLYIPVHLQPYYFKKYGYRKGDFPAAEKYYQHCLSIPIFPDLKKKEVNYVINKINSIIKIK